MRESKAIKPAKAILVGLAGFVGAITGALILSVILNREISKPESV